LPGNRQNRGVQKDLEGLLRLLEDSSDLELFLDNPVIPSKKQQGILTEIFKGKVEELTLRFILFLGSKKRLHCLASACAVFNRMCMDVQNISKVRMTSSVPVDALQSKDMADYLRDRFKKEILLEVQVDEAMLGGIKVQKEDTVYDGSFHAQLEKFKKNVMNV